MGPHHCCVYPFISGTGGLDEFKGKLKDDQPAFGFLRITIGNDELVSVILLYPAIQHQSIRSPILNHNVSHKQSKRAKFVLVSWCGPQVKVMRKAKLSVHIADVKSVIKNFAVEIAAGSKEVKCFLTILD